MGSKAMSLAAAALLGLTGCSAEKSATDTDTANVIDATGTTDNPDANGTTDSAEFTLLSESPSSSVLVFGGPATDRAYAMEKAGASLLIAGSDGSSGDGFICDVLAGDCKPSSWVAFGDPTTKDWIEALSAAGGSLLVAGKVESGGSPGSTCSSSGDTDGFTQLWDIGSLGVEIKCAQYATNGPDEIMAAKLVGNHAFVAGTRWSGGDQDAHLRRYDVTSPTTDMGKSGKALSLGAGGGSLEEAFWVALGPTLGDDARMLYFGGRTAGNMVHQCGIKGGVHCTGAPAAVPGAADGWVAGVVSDPSGLTLRWLHQFSYNGKDNIQNGIYVEDEDRKLLVLVGSIHEENNPNAHACKPFAESGLEYSDALLVVMPLDADGDFTGSETLATAMWGEAACDVGESFQGLAFDPETNEVHVSGTSGGAVDHGGQTGNEDGVYMRFQLGLDATTLKGLKRVDAVRIQGDEAAGADSTDRIYDLVLDGDGRVHLIGDTASTFSQAPWFLPAPDGTVDALYVSFLP